MAVVRATGREGYTVERAEALDFVNVGRHIKASPCGSAVGRAEIDSHPAIVNEGQVCVGHLDTSRAVIANLRPRISSIPRVKRGVAHGDAMLVIKEINRI